MTGGAGRMEVERKFSVGAGFVMPDLSTLPGVAAVTGPHTFGLSAVYFDTPGLRLARARITLRRRTGGPDEGWHLKLPAGAERREVHAPLSAGAQAVPAGLAAMVSDVTGGELLRPVARLQTARTVRHLTGEAGRVLAEVADDRVTGSVPEAGQGAGPAGPGRAAGQGQAAGDQAADPVRAAGGDHAAPDRAAGPDRAGEDVPWRVVAAWREVEVELVDGTPDLLGTARRALLPAGAAPSPAASKLGIVLESAGLLPAEPPRPD